MQSEKQIGLRFAKQLAVQTQIGDTPMTYRTSAFGRLSRRLMSQGAGLTGLLMMGGGASAQSTEWYFTPNQTTIFENLTSLNPVVNSVPAPSNLPLFFNVGGASGQITFSGSSVVAQGGAIHNVNGSRLAGNYLVAVNGAVTFDFATQQRFFGMRWGSIDLSNTLAFYNGAQLVQTVTGSQAFAARAGASSNHSYDAGFSFGDIGFTRVVATATPGAAFEFGNVAVSEAAAVAPIPLGGVGGIVALLGMVALRRRRGGRLPQRLLAFASGARRQQAQRFA
jgi:hypothetical protein